MHYYWVLQYFTCWCWCLLLCVFSTEREICETLGSVTQLSENRSLQIPGKEHKSTNETRIIKVWIKLNSTIKSIIFFFKSFYGISQIINNQKKNMTQFRNSLRSHKYMKSLYKIQWWRDRGINALIVIWVYVYTVYRKNTQMHGWYAWMSRWLDGWRLACLVGRRMTGWLVRCIDWWIDWQAGGLLDDG